LATAPTLEQPPALAQEPTPVPTQEPTLALTQEPTPPPTQEPTPAPTQQPTVQTPPQPATLHVADLDGAGSRPGKGWQASVTIRVAGPGQADVAGATVNGAWSGGYQGPASCTTDAGGACSLGTPAISDRAASVTFTVTDVSHASLAYQAADNADPDGDSNGMSIMLNKP
jgi:hypothetical protein